eukprot:4994143-Amphidinium_carterae.1
MGGTPPQDIIDGIRVHQPVRTEHSMKAQYTHLASQSSSLNESHGASMELAASLEVVTQQRSPNDPKP